EERIHCGLNFASDRHDGVVAPRTEHEGDEARRTAPISVGSRLPAKLRCDACAQERALADAALGVEQRQSVGAEIGKNDADLVASSEEEVGLVFCEVHEADERPWGDGDPCRT